MNDFPDFSHHGYQLEQELGQNRAGGRITYLATETNSQQSVVIKQFQFAKSGATWAEFDAYDREIQLLKELNHPGIPRYLDSFQTPDGFCMVQEYKKAVSLAVARSFNPDTIKQIAISGLEILVYLQNRLPPIIHRDLKPENILIDEQGAIYLVDFGFARAGGGEVGVSSVVKGTLGFMPPEQLFNRQLTEASDLYGLGMTLICLLTGTQSDRIGDLVDISYRVSFKHLVPKLNLQWVNWLEKMVEPRLKDRFPNAVTALAGVPVSPLRLPEAQFSCSTLEWKATRLGEPLTQTVIITNPIPETTLEARWEIAPHPNDPHPDRYRWITVDPPTFEGSQSAIQVTVDTRPLMAGKTYSRKLLLHANTLAKTYSLNLLIHTAPIATAPTLQNGGLLSLLGLFAVGWGWLFTWVVLILGTLAEAGLMAGLGAMVGTAIGLELAAWMMRSAGWRTGFIASTLAAMMVAGAAIASMLASDITTAGSVVVSSAVTGGIGGAIAGLALGTVVEKLISRGSYKNVAIGVSLLTMLFGSSLGLNLTLNFANPPARTLLLLSSFCLLTLIVHAYLKRANTHFSHRQAERHLIKP